jgi:hypothetical protein
MASFPHPFTYVAPIRYPIFLTMMLPRKTIPRVKNGRVQRKNRDAATAPDDYTLGASFQIVRHAPGPYNVHVVDEHDVRRFLGLLPDWSTLGVGIPAIVIDANCQRFEGCYRKDGVIVLTSWPAEMMREVPLWHYDAHWEVFQRIGVPCEIVEAPTGEDVACELEPEPFARCWFEPHTARDYMLMHTLLHELGHHQDARTQRRGARVDRGEDYAEAFAFQREQELWPRYRAAFGRPARAH